MIKRKKKGVVIWGIVTVVLLGLFIAVNILAHGYYNPLLNRVMPGGGARPVYEDGVEPIYPSDKSKEEVLSAARAFNVELGEEGFILLKNNGALPLRTPVSESDRAAERPKISIFGKNSVNLAYGGGGSSATATAGKIDLYTALGEAGYDCNPVLKSFYEDTKASGPVRGEVGQDLDSGDTVLLSTAETPQASYTDAVKDSYDDYGDAALIVLTRVSSEAMDLPRVTNTALGGRNDTDHFLQLDKNEADLIAAVCGAGFEKVVLVLNACGAMELGFLDETSSYATDKGYSIDPSKIDAAVWMGFPGDTGTRALGSILNGNVNPSGRTTDTYVTDLTKDPTWFNFGDNRITGDIEHGVQGGDMYKLGNELQMDYFVHYEEGEYVGYRYYETRAASYTGAVAAIGEKNYQSGEEWYDASVVYPFGYGLSYTSFSWEIADDAAINGVSIAKDGKYTLTVRVTNEGTVAGKDVVQLYGRAPYTAGGIEKAEKVLLDFAKVEVAPGATESVQLTFDPYYLSSYDYGKIKTENGGYVLEKGDYSLIVGTDAHDERFVLPFSVDADIFYDTSTVNDDVPVENLYTDQANEAFDSDTQLSTVLSRSDWAATWPTTPGESDWNRDARFFAQLRDTSDNNPVDLENEAEMPVTEEPAGIALRDLLFDENGDPVDHDGDGVPSVSYDDERWDTFLDQAKVSEMIQVYNYAAYAVQKLDSLGMPEVKCADGPVGWTCMMDKESFYDTCNYVAQMVVGSTWNKALVYEYGQTVGEEGIVGDARRGVPYSGWYAPGVNIHRSAFGGRNFEYYSEDPVLSGKLAAEQIKGCQSKGVFCFVKHFALNEQETHRSISGLATWATEQSMREIYLKPFEIAVKEGGTRAMMSSFNRIGTRWTGGDYRLLTTILRDEWGFEGTVICDFNTIPAYMNSRQMAYAGGDLNLTYEPESWCDYSSAADVTVLRGCIKNVCYTLVNSNAMNGVIIGYDMAYWQIGLYVVDALLAVGLGVWGFFVFRKFVRSGREESDKE